MPDLMHSGEFYSALCAVLWAIAVVLFRKSGEHVPPVALNLFKGVFGLLMFLPTMAVLGLPFVPDGTVASDWAILLISGGIGIGVADTLFFESLNRLGAGRSAIVDCLYSPFVILCSFFALSEPLPVTLFAAVALMGAAIFAGTWQPGGRASGPEARRVLAGVGIGALAMLLMAVGVVLTKPVLDRFDTCWVTSVRLLGGVAVLTVLGLAPGRRAATIRAFTPGPVWRITIPASFVGTYLAILVWMLGMKYTYTTTASVLNQLSNVLILPLAAIFLKEPLRPRHYAALALGIAGGLVAAF